VGLKIFRDLAVTARIALWTSSSERPEWLMTEMIMGVAPYFDLWIYR
jgi:hypothetical protein